MKKQNKKQSKNSTDHSYLFSGMTDAEFAAEGVRMARYERGEDELSDFDEVFDDESEEIPDDEPEIFP